MRMYALVAAAIFASASSLSAQAVHGKIISDSGGAPLPNVIIVLMDKKGDTATAPVRSDEEGRFVLRVKDPGTYSLKAIRLAFSPAITNAFELKYRGTVNVQLVMNRQAVLLSPMVVVSSSLMSGSDMMSAEGFEWRRLRATGTFLDTAVLRKAGYPPFSTFVRENVPSVYIVPGFTGQEEIRMTVQGRECTPDLYRDGALQGSMMVSHFNNTNSQEYYGIEAYRHPNVPMEFRRTGLPVLSSSNTLSGDCGVVALWTKWHGARRGGSGRGANGGSR